MKPAGGSCELFVLGAGGMMAGELLRLAASHPRLCIGGAVTREGGEALGRLHPHLVADSELTCLSLPAFVEELSVAPDPPCERWLVLALPHGSAAAAWRGVRDALGERAEALGVLDLSADYRLRDLDLYEHWYGAPHADPEGAERFAYGLPELSDADLSSVRRIAAPGCFATALQLACVPAAEAGWLDLETTWILHAATGSSGSGAKPKPLTHHPHRHADFRAYASDGHRHEAELAQALAPALPSGARPKVLFLPHSGPWARGIHASCVLPLAGPRTRAEAHELYRARYEGRPFVRVLDGEVPDLRRVVGSNTACLGVRVREDALVVEVTLDNLIKGGSGQALQALNLALGLPETEGLPAQGMGTL